MTKVFLDSDVILDLLLDRQPFSAHAAVMFALAETARIELCTSTVSFLNVYYVAGTQCDRRVTDRLIRKLRSLLTLLPVTPKNIDTALAARSRDIEDYVQYSCAQDNGMSFLVTRNLKDYPTKGIPVMTPEVFLSTVPQKS